MQSTDATTYDVLVTNSISGGTPSNTATLTVNTAGAPVITTGPSNQTVTVGSPVTFNVAVTGSTPLTYQWGKDGAAIAGATGSSLSLNSVLTTDAGTYAVSVTNSLGSASAAATLNVTTSGGSGSGGGGSGGGGSGGNADLKIRIHRPAQP